MVIEVIHIQKKRELVMNYTLTYYYVRYHKNGSAWIYPKPYCAIIDLDTCKKLMKHCYGTCKTKMNDRTHRVRRLDFRCYDVHVSTPKEETKYRKMFFVSAQDGTKPQNDAWDNFVKLGIPEKQAKD